MLHTTSIKEFFTKGRYSALGIGPSDLSNPRIVGATAPSNRGRLRSVGSPWQVVEGKTLPELVRSYNERRGASLGCRGKSTLLLPLATVQSFFVAVVSKIVRHVRELLEVGALPGGLTHKLLPSQPARFCATDARSTRIGTESSCSRGAAL